MNYACNQNKYNIFYIDMMKNKIHRFKYSNFASKKNTFQSYKNTKFLQTKKHTYLILGQQKYILYI